MPRLTVGPVADEGFASTGCPTCYPFRRQATGHAEENPASHETDQAEAAFRRSLESAEGNPFFAAWASARLGACLARQGRPRKAEPHVQAALSTGTPLTRYEARWAHAELLAARGDDQECRTQAADALRAAREGGCLVLVPHLQELARS